MSKKKDNGFGSIRQRKDGLWEARLQIGTLPNGKPNRKSVYGKTETEVKRKLRQLLKNGEEYLLNKKKQSFGEYILVWLETFKKIKLKPSSYDRLETTIKCHIIPANGYIQIHALTSLDIQRHINKMQEDGYSFSTIKKVYLAYNACLKAALYDDVISKNPCYTVTLPNEDELESKEIKILSAEEQERFIREAKRKYRNGKNIYRLGYAFILVLNTGIRLGELLAIRWDKIDFERRIMTVNSSCKMVKNRNKKDESKNYVMNEGSTKSKSGNRKIPLNDDALDALYEMKKVTGNFNYVMTTSKGKIITPRSITNTIECIYANSDNEKDALHKLRHTFASNLFRRGVDIKIISKFLGHSNVSITYNIYIHIIEELEFEAVEKLNFPYYTNQLSA